MASIASIEEGQVILATINESAVVPFVSQQLNNLELALSIAGRASLPGAEALITPRFDALFNSGDFKGAAELAAKVRFLENDEYHSKSFSKRRNSRGLLRQRCSTSARVCKWASLNKIESVELAKLVLRQNKKQLIDQWFAEDKLEPSEELGDVISPVDSDMALKLYSKGAGESESVRGVGEKRRFRDAHGVLRTRELHSKLYAHVAKFDDVRPALCRFFSAKMLENDATSA